MLPSARKYLIRGGLSPQATAFTTIGCFLGGVISIQAVSRLLHHHIPSHVVDCSHTHEDEELEDSTNVHGHTDNHHEQNGFMSEVSPLLFRENSHFKPKLPQRSESGLSEITPGPYAHHSLQTRLKKQVSSLVLGGKISCYEGGPCFGYSDPCAQECFKVISRSPTVISSRPTTSGSLRRPSVIRSATAPFSRSLQEGLMGVDEDSPIPAIRSSQSGYSAQVLHQSRKGYQIRGISQPLLENQPDDLENHRKGDTPSSSKASIENDTSHSHHHHVPTNAFLAIGLQTSIAIALHKLPEGFITFATNHANPQLGFTIFMALFIHNITEGFAMALPLYLALGSRWKSMLWSSLLGGISQPLGAGIAALWFQIAGSSDHAPDDAVYGCMFAITAGVMASVALQLFSESLGLTHNRNLCMAFAFVGMGIMGASFALTAS